MSDRLVPAEHHLQVGAKRRIIVREDHLLIEEQCILSDLVGPFRPNREIPNRTFTRLPPGQWRSARTTNAIERLHEEFKRRIKTQTVLPSADTAAMLFWALLASGQINMRKVDGWQTLATKPIDQPIDLAA
jgi:hypothetical protein